MGTDLPGLKRHLRGRTRLTTTSVRVAKETYRLTHPASAEALFDEREFALDERIPYWADLWPSARALAGRLAALDLVGKTAVELGCGIGLPSVVAARRGASCVTLTDHYAPALDFAAHNVLANARVRAKTHLLDWHKPGRLEGFGPFDLVLAADVLYERRNVEPLADLVPRLLAEGGEVLLADPRRAGGELFVRELETRGFGVRSEKTSVVGDGREVIVAVHALSRR